jgi:hypothetical protein
VFTKNERNWEYRETALRSFSSSFSPEKLHGERMLSFGSSEIGNGRDLLVARLGLSRVLVGQKGEKSSLFLSFKRSIVRGSYGTGEIGLLSFPCGGCEFVGASFRSRSWP